MKIRVSIGQFMDFLSLARPTPAMAPVTVWVVDMGMPHSVATNNKAAAPPSAAQPFMGLRVVILEPMVFWASLPPWVRLKQAEENNCRCLKIFWALRSLRPSKSLLMSFVSIDTI
ncbi:MAG: hypothetical protein A3F17_06620 [Gammaproteobacteria bacterium RIFCSPHIGHO2_12_FULL_41_15]|nr:MAG: hypothetical protein A3F17_06620 [Gammaproteobacteria bacterium RIFCSPHIGHO2_12_FULL_41_15]